MKIDSKKYYKPRDIAKYKLIRSRRNDCSYNFVLSEIKIGSLNAVDWGKGNTPYWMVKGEEILRYRKVMNMFFDK